MIRKATIADLPRLQSLAKIFMETSRFVNVDQRVFLDNWQTFLSNGYGVIFIIEKDDKFTGAIGGVKHPDLNDGSMTAVELFWIVDPEHRGGAGMRLWAEFEKWAEANGCKRVAMIHLADSMPDRLQETYLKHGYSLVEMPYVKEI